MEPVMEKIKDIVAQMPQETHQVDQMLEEALPKSQYHKNNLEEITADYIETPIFEPVTKPKEETQKSLNDQLKGKGLSIGLNDKIAFIKHLFNDDSKDYERVLSQLNTVSSFKDASHFINSIVKPDYDNWKGKEDYEERFLEIIEDSFQ